MGLAPDGQGTVKEAELSDALVETTHPNRSCFQTNCGDALAAEFNCTLDLIRVALECQSLNRVHDLMPADSICPQVHVGVARGETVIADETATGRGFILAQRVEQLARPGGVCFTAALLHNLPWRPVDPGYA